jgi:hypothetical protein
MKEYIVIPPSDVAEPAALAKWIEQARAYGATLPKKQRAVKKTAAKKATRPRR